MNEYLHASAIIDWTEPNVLAKAKQLASDVANDSERETTIVRRCFEFVRDEIKHSHDYQLKPITCKASDVLQHKTGYCYAKSHLLAALLRANSIPTGLCYQRLVFDHDSAQKMFGLHGLNAVYLQNLDGDKSGWYRLDARGNKPSVNAQFTPPVEQLAFDILVEGEGDFAEIFAQPLPIVVQALEQSTDTLDRLPDMPIPS